MPKPSFDTWTIIFLFAAIQGLFVSLTLYFRKEKHISRIFLGTITLIFSLILIEYVLYWTHYLYQYPYLITLSNSLVFTFGPLYYLYFKSVFLKNSLSKTDALHFLPLLLSLLAHSPILLLSVEHKRLFLEGKMKISCPNWFPFFVVMGIISMTTYVILIYYQFRQFASINKTVKNWFNFICLFFAGFTLSHISYYILCNFSFFNSEWDYAISFCMTLFIYALAWYGYKQPSIFNGFSIWEEEKVKYKNSPVNKDIGKELVEKLAEKMAEKKYFLYPDLNLDKLAELMETPKHYLSQAINEHLKMNFYEYINSLRIEEAKTLLVSDKQYTIIEVAYQVGYNNKVSFNKAFKSISGQTPTEFRASRKE